MKMTKIQKRTPSKKTKILKYLNYTSISLKQIQISKKMKIQVIVIVQTYKKIYKRSSIVAKKIKKQKAM
jgi:hypothetical protein